MSVTADLSISGEEFVLGTALLTDADVHIELERVVPSSRQVLPFFWAIGSDFETFENDVRSNPNVQSLIALDRIEGRVLYRVEWSEEVESFIYGIAEVGATILEATGDRVWRFRLRFHDHGALSAFHDYCEVRNIGYTLDRVVTDLAEEREEFGLTPEQRETLMLALERDYFDVPRGVTLGELADELGVTQQSVSERVRRGTGSVLEAVLLEANGRDTGPT
ncbi:MULTISPECIES: helix-turn-helix domain-containing protein [unclassified Haladaptatus]|uniref:helix-turn-helix domain-containing protein n=1 Tax=unclassified Haladaptatus TaxID=2622732 RepID=UPI00209BBF73|nr:MULTISPECIES: helix-turn-helix domain-containing protein [unclassified Haladaptatus]MCO8245048.1 helix-turn-helix domain-containing protein [Haladaptatus sp. AB643]MCO8253190.1 helix-turn-helix domain-containing protein [Haladaptatus sp. AB618]